MIRWGRSTAATSPMPSPRRGRTRSARFRLTLSSRYRNASGFASNACTTAGARRLAMRIACGPTPEKTSTTTSPPPAPGAGVRAEDCLRDRGLVFPQVLRDPDDGDVPDDVEARREVRLHLRGHVRDIPVGADRGERLAELPLGHRIGSVDAAGGWQEHGPAFADDGDSRAQQPLFVESPPNPLRFPRWHSHAQGAHPGEEPGASY